MTSVSPIAAEMQEPPAELRGLTAAELTALLAEGGFEPYRARQLYHWLYVKGAESLEEMTNLPRALREWLGERTRVGAIELARIRGAEGATRKALFRLGDGKFIESVLMRDEPVAVDDTEAAAAPARISFCLSSQVGCALGCTFCRTGFGGFQRNLTPGEIVGQALTMRRRLLAAGETLQHIVFMGMGEPMHNLDNVLTALRLLTDPEGFKLSRRRITVSTVGWVPGIERLGASGVGVNLAVSLNATTDETRSTIMPVNRRYPIGALLEALRRYPLEPRRRITIEYVLLRGVNDTPADARRLVGLLRGLRCKVNLITFNACPELAYEPVEAEGLDRFAAVLSEANMTVTVRWSKGRELEAACGQLAAHVLEAARG